MIDGAPSIASPAPGNATRAVLVPFRGDGHGVEPLAWGQIGLWQSIESSGMSKTVPYVTELPAGTTAQALATTLASMVGRHQSLRTRLILDGDGPPKQSCAESGEITLEIVDAGGDNPARVAEAVSQRYQTVPFEYRTEWPVRMAAVERDGVLTHMVLVILHLSIDAYGWSTLAPEFATPGVVPDRPVTGMPPLEQARRQAAPAGQRQNQASLRYLERVVRSVPSRPLGPEPDGEPEIRMVHLRSPATALAIRAVAARTGLSTSTALLAAFGVGLARSTGVNPIAAMLLVNNRFRPGFEDSVSALVQISPYLIDVAGGTLDQALSRAAQGVMNAYRHAYYDPYQQDEVIERIEAERGEPLHFWCFYNDRRQEDRGAADAPAPTLQQLRDAPASELYWADEISMPRMTLYFNVDSAPDATVLAMSADTRYLSPSTMESIVRGVELAAVSTALDGSAPTGVDG